MGKKGIPHRKWSKEEKLKIIHLHLDEHMSLLKIEKEYGIRNGLVCTWVKSIWKKERTLLSHTTEIHMRHCIQVNH